MPLDVLGCTRATLMEAASVTCTGRYGKSCETPSCWGQTIAIIGLQRGIPSKRKSSACVDYVPALCTHRPSLLPIEWLSEASGAGILRNWDFGETGQTWSFRGSKSRNKVSVGEPAEGSLQNDNDASD